MNGDFDHHKGFVFKILNITGGLQHQSSTSPSPGMAPGIMGASSRTTGYDHKNQIRKCDKTNIDLRRFIEKLSNFEIKKNNLKYYFIIKNLDKLNNCRTF